MFVHTCNKVFYSFAKSQFAKFASHLLNEARKVIVGVELIDERLHINDGWFAFENCGDA